MGGKANWEETISGVFQSTWHLACLKHKVLNNNDFFCFDLMGTPVVLQNFDGHVRCYLNVCSHRQSIIHTTPCGNGPLRCPYHGWTYDSEGVPVGIPGNRELFGFSTEDKRALALASFPVSICGNCVFVAGSDAVPPLSDWLGPYLPVIEDITTAATDCFDSKVVQWDCDWTYAIENAIESYHTPLVHRETLAPAVQADGKVEKLGSSWSSFETRVTPRTLRYWRYVAERLNYKNDTKHREMYKHYIVHPNLMLGITDGALVNLQSVAPLGPGRSLISYWLLLPEASVADASDEEFRDSVRTAMRGVTDKLMDEDRAVAEYAHRGGLAARRPPVFGANEQRIVWFRQWIDEQMRGS